MMTFTGVSAMAKRLDVVSQDYNRKIMNALNSVMAEMVDYIKAFGPWEDQTSNLRNSINYVPAYFGTPADVTQHFTNVESGARATLNATNQTSGNTITGVIYAGMEYAIYIEYMPGRWVISGAFTQYKSMILSMLKKAVKEQS